MEPGGILIMVYTVTDDGDEEAIRRRVADLLGADYTVVLPGEAA